MFTSIKNVWQLLGVTLALVALYLVLTNSTGFARLIGAATTGWSGVLKTLQGRG